MKLRNLPVWLRILLLVIGLPLGLLLMGQDFGTTTGKILAGIGAALMLGLWLGLTRVGGVDSAGEAHNRRTLQQTLVQLERFETPYLQAQAGQLYLLRGKPKKAIPHLRRALELDSGLLEAHYLLGQAFLTQKQPREAWPHLSVVYERDPGHNYGEIKLWAARLYLALDEPDTALSILEAFRQDNPDHPECTSLRAEALEGMGRLAQAKDAYREVLDLTEHSPEFQRQRLAKDIDRARRKVAQLPDDEQASGEKPASPG